jgi:GxxExxY protein
MPETNYPLQDETRLIIGVAFEIHATLGKGFLEIVYKDALEYELKRKAVHYEREKEYLIAYKTVILPHKFFADFVVFDGVIVEVKAQSGISEADHAQLLNYLRASGCKVGLILNFGEVSLRIKRMVL